jgi:hypothetical protein
LLSELLSSIGKTFPVPAQFVRAIPKDIAGLSRLLTSARPERKDGYLGVPRNFSAYIRYFLPWNIYKLCKLFSSDELSRSIKNLFTDNTVITDLGSGPLSVPLALWCAFPGLHKKMTVYAVDQNKNTLKAGRELFTSFAGMNSWKIVTICERIESDFKTPPANLVTAAFTLNEAVEKIPQADTAALGKLAKKTALRLIKRTEQAGAILIVEPGVPRSAQFLSLLKEAFEELGFFARFPCPLETNCCMRGGRRGSKWCHFVFDTDDAPDLLQETSAQAGLPKERAALSFLFLQNVSTGNTSTPLCADSVPLPIHSAPFSADSAQNRKAGCAIRVISEAFRLPENKMGRYCCSPSGLLLIRGAAAVIIRHTSGTLLKPDTVRFAGKDRKSGAVIVDI